MNKLSSTSVSVIASTVAGHILFSLQYPDAWLLGVVGFVLVIAIYIAISRKKSSSAQEDLDEDVKSSEVDDQKPIGKDKARDKRRFIKITF